MKYIAIAMLIVACAALLIAGDTQENAKSSPQFDKMKSLVGTWKGKDDEGKPVIATYKLVSGGNSLMESLEMQEHPDAMITMYHLNGSKLMMTHYCSMGNQPRMRMDNVSKDGNTYTFKFVDATNLASKKDAHMSKLVVTFKDDDHFSQEWTMNMDGKDAHHAMFDFERAK